MYLYCKLYCCNILLAEQINTLTCFSSSYSLVFIRVTLSIVSTLTKVYILTE